MALFWHNETTVFCQIEDTQKERIERLKSYLHDRHFTLLFLPDYHLFVVPSEQPAATMGELCNVLPRKAPNGS